jgi:hypothetical protein
MWDARDDVILTEAERKVLAELEAAASRRKRAVDLWRQVRSRPRTLLIGSVVGVTVSLCFTIAVFAASLAAGVVGSLLVLVSLAALLDGLAAEGRARRQGSVAEQRARRPDAGPGSGGTR